MKPVLVGVPIVLGFSGFFSILWAFLLVHVRSTLKGKEPWCNFGSKGTMFLKERATRLQKGKSKAQRKDMLAQAVALAAALAVSAVVVGAATAEVTTGQSQHTEREGTRHLSLHTVQSLDTL